ncbi:Cobaltochelatase subunit CobT [Acetobacteraceae bacterium EV16G]|uniref:Cobaltochelatase subunit CobT n=1 Tax=Sorlinia euscelidii TaxID=3081148 RepID=A0ABU7U5N3_9PROT
MSSQPPTPPKPDPELGKRDSGDGFRRATKATLRAMAGDPHLAVTFLEGPPQEESQGTVHLPYMPRHVTSQEEAEMRGVADAEALFRKHHDLRLDISSRIPDPTRRATFEAMEQARCEVYGARMMRGVQENLAARLQRKCFMQGTMRMQEKADMPAPLAFELLLRDAMMPGSLPRLIGPALSAWRDSLSPVAQEKLRHLAAIRDDQAAFSESFLELFATLDTPDHAQDAPPPATQEDAEPAPSPDDADDAGGEASQDEPSEKAESEGDEADEEGEMEGELGRDDAPPGDDPSPTMSRGDPEPSEAEAASYRIFTTEYDEEANAADLCDPEELAHLRHLLDQQLSGTQSVVARLAHKLQRRLMTKQQRSWQFDQEEGLLDATRLPRIVINPATPLSFKIEHESAFKDTIVTLLIDNSGSMRGRPISVAALCSDILARTLERCHVKTELLGFTTRTWKGGKSRQDWLEQGRPENPGRLNDTRHIIYKNADSPYRRARLNLGLMLKEGLLKENIDGEALLWAWQRLLKRHEKRRILLVISDGAPVDDSTFSANNHAYLEEHLRAVIRKIESQKSVELLAIGIGHDVTRYYRNSITIRSADELGGTVLKKLLDLFGED